MQVIIISYQSLFREGIKHSLSRMGDIEILEAAGESDSEILVAIDNLPPDVAIVDIDGQPDDRLKLARQIKQHSPNIAIVVLTSDPNDIQLFQALKAQAAAYLSKETSTDYLIDVVRRVARGEHPINESLATRPKVAEQVLNQFQELPWKSELDTFVSPLTRREIEVLKHIGQGLPNKQIAIQLGISEQTIKNHVTSILRKLNANARTEAMIVAIKKGLISID